MPEVPHAEPIFYAIQHPKLADLPSEILAEPLQDSSGGILGGRGFCQHAHQGDGDGSKPLDVLARGDIVNAQHVVARAPVEVADERDADQGPPDAAVSMEVALLGLE